MPGMEDGGFGAAEKDWGQDLSGSKEKRELEKEAIAALRKVQEELNADPFQIDVEEYPVYLEAAQVYLDTIKNDEKFTGDKFLTRIAQDIIDKAPTSAAA